MWQQFEIRNFEFLFVYSYLTVPKPEKHKRNFNKRILLFCFLGNIFMNQIGGTSICAVPATFWSAVMFKIAFSMSAYKL